MSASRAERIKQQLAQKRMNEGLNDVQYKKEDIVETISSVIPGLKNDTEVQEIIKKNSNINTEQLTNENNTNNEYKHSLKIVNTYNELIQKKITKQQTHRRQTYEIRLDLIKKLDDYASTQPRGFKGELINLLLDDFFNEMENK